MRNKKLLLRLISLSKGEFKSSESNLKEAATVNVNKTVKGIFNKDSIKLYEKKKNLHEQIKNHRHFPSSVRE